MFRAPRFPLACCSQIPCASRQEEKVGRLRAQLRGACAGAWISAVCHQARVCLPAPVLSVLIIRKCSLDGWSLPTDAGVEGLVLHASLEPLDPKRQRGGLT